MWSTRLQGSKQTRQSLWQSTSAHTVRSQLTEVFLGRLKADTVKVMLESALENQETSCHQKSPENARVIVKELRLQTCRLFSRLWLLRLRTGLPLPRKTGRPSKKKLTSKDSKSNHLLVRDKVSYPQSNPNSLSVRPASSLECRLAVVEPLPQPLTCFPFTTCLGTGTLTSRSV